MQLPLNNSYYVFEKGQWINCPLSHNTALGFGRDYFAEIFQAIEENGRLRNLTFFLSAEAPPKLPRYGHEVVLVIVADEYYRYFAYFHDILAVVRCYGPLPRYLDGPPITSVKLSAAVFFAFRCATLLRDLWRAHALRPSRLRHLIRKTLYVPLGCFGRFDPPFVQMQNRAIDYAFLGSIDRKAHSRYSIQNLMTPPKILSRNRLMGVLSQLAKSRPEWRGALTTTVSFGDSMSRADTYAETMRNCKVSICPRGSNHETYRFYESLKAGCVVVCEVLPKAWFYEDHPGIVLADWAKLPALLHSLLSDPDKMEALSQAGRNFWLTQLSETVTAGKIEAFLLELLSR